MKNIHIYIVGMFLPLLCSSLLFAGEGKVIELNSSNFDNTVAREIQAENDVEIALEDLRVITGKYHSNLSVLSTERFSATLPQPQTVDEWLKIAEERNLSLMVQRLGKDIAEDDIAAARAGHYPTATFNAQYTKDDVDLTIGTSPSASLPTQDTLRLSAQITVPIYQGGQVSARTTQARTPAYSKL